MSERWEESAAELEEARARIIAQQDERAIVKVIPYTPNPTGMDWETTTSILGAIMEHKKSEWIELWCDQHPTGAALRLCSDGNGWELEPMRRRSAPPLTIVGLPDTPEIFGVPVNAPSRMEVICSGCGRQLWRDPQQIIDDVFPALVRWQQRRTQGRHGRPRVYVSGATA